MELSLDPGGREDRAANRRLGLTLGLGLVGTAAAYMAWRRSAPAVARKWLRVATILLP